METFKHSAKFILSVLMFMMTKITFIIAMSVLMITPVVLALLRLLDVIYSLTDLEVGSSIKALVIFIAYLSALLLIIYTYFTIKQKLRVLEQTNEKFKQFKYSLYISTPRKIGHKVATYVLLIGLTVVFLFPMVWMVSSSTKSEFMIYQQMGSLRSFFPSLTNITDWFNNYQSVLVEYNLWKYALNSIFYSSVIVILNIIICSLAGYALAKFKFPGEKAIFLFIIALIIIPIETTIIPLYTIVHNLGLTGTIFAIIIPPVVSIFNIFLFRQFFKNIPVELEEAAQMDGASRLRIYWSIVIPLSKPIIATIATFVFIGTWNDYIWPIMVLPAPSGDTWPLYPIQAALNTIQQNPTITQGEILASLTLTTIPMIVFYVSMLKYIVEGLGTTGVKF